MLRVPLPLAQTAIAGLNHVLNQQPLLRQGLQAHAGRSVRIVVSSALGPVHSDAHIGPDGLLQAVASDEPAATLTLDLSVSMMVAGLRGGSEAVAPHLQVEGDLLVAAALAEVARSARWDFEEDLSRLTGDVVAHRIGQTLRGFGTALRELDGRASEAVSRGLTTAGGPLLGRREFDHFAAAIAALNARVVQLEQQGPR